MSNKKRPQSAMEEAGPALVPKLRFPEFRNSDDWRPETMSGVATVVMGSSPKSECYNESQNGLPLLQGNADIKNRLSAPRIFTSEITKECQVGDILMSVRAPVGSIAKSIHHACIGRGIAAIHAKQPNCQEFLYQWLLSYEPRWVNISQGGTFDAINSDDLKHVGLTTPKPAEQQKIAECLSSLDELMAAQARKVDALKTHKKGLMQQLFPREGETQPRLRFPEFRDAGEWEVTTIGDLKPFVTSGSRGWAPFYAEKGELFVRITNLWRDSIYLDLTDSKFVQLPPGANEGVRTQLKEHDVLISITADIGIIGYVDESVPSPAFINQHIALVRFDEGQLCGKYVAYFLASEKSQRLFRSSADTGTKAGMSLIGIQKIELMFPSLPEQKRIADCLSSLDALIAAETKKLEALKTHKKGLMQQLFPSPEDIEA
jgi:type I restriction enzyme S subunit